MQVEGLPPASRAALLLDFDGTLVEFAPSPMAVTVPEDLPGVLLQLRDRLGGALGIISGRPVHEIDHFLPGLPTAIAGEHGGAFRTAPGADLYRPALPDLPPDWLVAARALRDTRPGTEMEQKARGFALHYRKVPEAGPALHEFLLTLPITEAGFEILPSSMAWEVRPRGADKGLALRALMQQPPFAGRLPVFLGDDVTDQAAIDAARELGGAGYLVGPVFGNPAGVRHWLAQQAVSWAEG